jgi:hypothetical protein
VRTTEHAHPLGFRRLLEAAKAGVAVERIATDAGAELRPNGDDLRGRGVCHGGDNPTALVVQPKKARWWCFRCNEGGDVLDLYQRIHDLDDKRHALMNLAGEYGVEPHRRPRSWYAKQERQRPIREKIRAARVEVLRRRLFRYTVLPIIKATTPDADEYRAEVTRAWEDFRAVPVGMLLDRYDHLGGV